MKLAFRVVSTVPYHFDENGRSLCDDQSPITQGYPGEHDTNMPTGKGYWKDRDKLADLLESELQRSELGRELPDLIRIEVGEVLDDTPRENPGNFYGDFNQVSERPVAKLIDFTHDELVTFDTFEEKQKRFQDVINLLRECADNKRLAKQLNDTNFTTKWDIA